MYVLRIHTCSEKIKYVTNKNVLTICTLFMFIINFHFNPTALKGCRGIVFTHDVRMGGHPRGRWEKVCPGCISETVSCRKLIRGRDIGLGV